MLERDTKNFSDCAAMLLTIWAILMNSSILIAQDEKLRALDGEWLYVEDRTEGLPVEKQGPPMSVKFRLRVEKDAVVYPRPRGDERITLDGSIIEKEDGEEFITRHHGEWKHGWLEYTMERIRQADNESIFVLKRVFRPVEEGMLVYVFSNRTQKKVALYSHPDKIDLPEPAKAKISELSWLAGAWVGEKNSSTIEERWTPPKGGAMLGISRTVKHERMSAFEYLRIVEREDRLIYIAQPGGKPATEFVLTEIGQSRAVFLNPRHSYPQRIIYELKNEEVMTASIGWAKGGRLQSFTYKTEGE